MTTGADRWDTVERLYHSALAQPVDRRASYLAEACAGDEALRREVESLLAHHVSGEARLSRGAVAAAAGLVSDAGASALTGRRLGVYQILAPIGAGGMGEVYRARDTRLGRDVAVKILPRAFTDNPDRHARFEREARVLASLNHPNIATIYGLENGPADAGSHCAIAMELVDGETLAERIARTGSKGLPISEALNLARQIAEALDAAHEKGIVHRDLKPANIKITPQGVVKVLDFGLAKLGADPAHPSSTASPTMTANDTRDGLVIGTAAYMSPEQARGQAVDKRTDIWAFGCVLYQMLTGRAPFARDTITDTLAAIVDREPDWNALPSATPAPVRRLLTRCLEKDARQRLRDIGDARAELHEPAIADDRPTPRWVRPAATAVIAALIASIAATGWWLARASQSAPQARTFRLTIDPPAGTRFRGDSGGAISPDGQSIAFITSSEGPRLWVRRVDALQARPIPGTDDATFPFWSPDSRSIGFFALAKLKRVDVDAGLPVTVCDVVQGRGGAWNQDGVILFNGFNDGPLLRVSASGGTPVPLTTIDAASGENSHRWPQFLPDGQRFLYLARGRESSVYAASLDHPEDRVRVLANNTNAVYAAGLLFYVRNDGSLVAQSFDASTRQLAQQPLTVADGVAFADASRLAAFSVSADGTVVYSGSEARDYQLASYDRSGRPMANIGPPATYFGIRISPDGTRVAFNNGGDAFASGGDIWQMEIARGVPTRVTFNGSVSGGPIWSPDGTRIVYNYDGPPNLYMRNANGTGAAERLTESGDSQLPLDWSANGDVLVYESSPNDLSSGRNIGLWQLSMTGDRRPAAVSSPFRMARAQLSPDGKWIAYTSNESGRNEIYVQSFPSGGMKWRVSTRGGDWVRWNDPQELFYVAPDRKLVSVPIKRSPDALTFGSGTELFTLGVSLTAPNRLPYSYDVMRGGQRVLAVGPVAAADDAPPMTVLLNWRAK